MAHRILAEQLPRVVPGQRMWLTTMDVAKLLHVTPQWVRWLARQGDLPSELTEAGQRIFRRSEVRRVLIQRLEAHARNRPMLLRAVRVRMLKVGPEPRQVSLFGPRLKLVRSEAQSERSLSDAKVKPARSFGKVGQSDTLRSVNQKAAGSRR